MHTLRIGLAQINPLVGDINGNTRLIISMIKEARKAGADLVAFPELAITGYPRPFVRLSLAVAHSRAYCKSSTRSRLCGVLTHAIPEDMTPGAKTTHPFGMKPTY